MTRYLLAAMALACSAWVGAAPANATASGYEYWSPFTFNGITVPGGQLFHRIEGRGQRVSCTRFPWTAICPTGDRHGEVQHGREHA